MLGNKYALGHSLSPEHKSKLIKSGKDHWEWRGDKVSYSGLHKWVNKHKGRPSTCEHCGRTGLTGKQIHWANKSKRYLRNLSDWIRLCSTCHGKYDSQ